MTIDMPAPLHVEAGVTPLFKRVLVGIDRSPESVEAARQAAMLTDSGGDLTLLGAWSPPPPAIGVIGADLSREDAADAYREAAEEAVATAKAAVASIVTPTTAVTRGFAWDELLGAAERGDSTLIALGSHGQGRVRGILMGSTATHVVHKAPCSVLIARPAGHDFPRRIVVGIDGSIESAAAYDVARHASERFGSELWPVVAHGANGIDQELIAAIVGYGREDSPDEPVTALLAASSEADLLVVGSRGLHGFKALGSVSERVAHRARCSTLIVRPPANSSSS
jgi:nucleotide-binding universal stress UspA family protein